MATEDQDIIIVGAGIAGLYCAWRLLEAGVSPDQLSIFEATHRTGGRVSTVRLQRAPSIRYEAGAHYINMKLHRLATGLTDRLRLSAAPASVGGKKDLVRLRGTCRSERQIRRSYFRKAFPYALDRRRLRRSPRHMLNDALAACVDGPAADEPVPLNALLARRFGSDGLQFLADRIGYSFLKEPLNARVTLQWLLDELFGGRFARPEGGMSALVDSIASQISSNGVAIHFNHRLTEMKTGAGSERPVLRFETETGRSRKREAGRVILALPPAAIERIGGIANEKPVRQLLGSVIPWPILTAAAIYSEPWWRATEFAGQRMLTDMPVGRLRFHDSEDGPAIITMYAEGGKSGYWQDLAGPNPKENPLAPDSRISMEFTEQLRTIFSRRARRPVPLPEELHLQDWQGHPSGAGLHFWTFGSRPEEMSRLALQPLPGAALHICGEAWSLRQGWIEGALESAEALLQQHLGLPPFETAED